MSRLRFAAFLLIAACAASPLMAEDYYLAPASRIAPELDRSLNRNYYQYPTRLVHVDGGGEAYVAMGQRLRAMIKGLDNDTRRLLTSGWVVCIRCDGDLPAEARFLEEQQGPLTTVKIRAADFQKTDKLVFLGCQRESYARVLRQGHTGSAWFRYQVRQLDKQIGFEDARDLNGNRRFFGNRGSSVTETFALASGGRALSENLQLGRQLPNPRDLAAESTVDISEISGITVKEFDWREYVKDIDPDVDPLAKFIPHDQHAVFFKDFPALVRFADEAAEQGTPILRLAEPQGIDAMVRQRYETQLGLSLDGLAELIGPQLIDTVAITGGDPYFRTGTDVAVMFSSKQMVALQALLGVQTQLRAEQDPAAQRVSGKLKGGTPYNGMKSPDDRIRSYLAVIGDAVVVANSLTQLERLEAVAQGKTPSMGSLDEYRYFRHRYPRSQENESGLVVVTDATIRRWCGPKWRIATSRRTRAAAALLDLQSQYLGQLAAGNLPSGREIIASYESTGTTKFVTSSSGLRSDSYGDMRFQTPIDEMELPRVTPEERRLYERWRDGYQSNWSNYFDPIAIRFLVDDSDVGLDMTVMPLIDFSRYREMVSISKGATLQENAGDPHPESILHWTLAINTESPIVKQGADMARNFTAVTVNPLSWLGDDLSLYIDQDPLWAKMADLNSESELEEFFLDNLDGIPFAAHFDVKSAMRLTLFLTAVRSMLDQVAPDMLVWTPVKHNERSYVRITLSEQGKAQNFDEVDDLALYYAVSGKSFTVSLSEAVIKRAIDRDVARIAGKEIPHSRQQLGGNLAFHVEGSTLPMIAKLLSNDYQRAMQRVAFSNIPILNEWKQRFPDRDPVEFHREFWQQRLVCPGGGKYVWNEEYQTMESTVYGHPAVPKTGPGLPPTLTQFEHGDFGLTFEEDGLRARVQLKRKQ